MQDLLDYKKFAVLYVDDEEKSLKLFARAFSGSFRILTAPNAQEGLKILQEHRHDIGVLMSDERMPGEKGVWLLDHARQLEPRIVRILATAYADMDAAIAAVNAGAIYRYITKPWDPVQLEQTLKRSLEFFVVQRERDQLLTEKMSILHNLMIADRIVSLGLLAAGLSHHIRNALVAVKTFLDLAPAKMQEEKKEPDKLRNPEFWRDYYRNVQGQIEKINHLLKELGSASEDPSFQFNDTVNVREIVNEVISSLAEPFSQAGIRVENNIPDSLPPLKVDKARFSRLFELLLRDELASLAKGNTVTFSGTVPRQNGDEASEVTIQIHDTGPGLPKDALRLLFDPFVVRSESPMEYGINLMACYFIVHYHGGKILAESEQGQGTTFTLRLRTNPMVAPPTQESPEFLQRALLNQTLWQKLAAS